MKGNREVIIGLLAKAGIGITSGPSINPWDIKVRNTVFYDKAIRGSLGLGESYMDGDWDCDQLDECISRILSAQLDKEVGKDWNALTRIAAAKLFNLQSLRLAGRNVEHHYDIGNDLYHLMLDTRMVYTCAYWDKEGMTLGEAQERKLELTCQKLRLKPGMHVLDIGCGFSSFAKYAAERYGVHVDGITLSTEQATLGKKLCDGLSVHIHLWDYRHLPKKLNGKKYDAIVSLGMFEHVGPKNYRTYMQIAADCLKDEGIFLLHTIGGNISLSAPDPWISSYIFPEAVIPSLSQISKATEHLFVIEDVHNFGPYYDHTLMAWHENFVAGWPQLKGKKRAGGGVYDERFFRMWVYYLLACAGSFRCRKNQLWQIVLTKHGFKTVFPRIS